MSVDAAIDRYRQATAALKSVETVKDWHAVLAAAQEAERKLIHVLRGAIEGLGPPFARMLVLDRGTGTSVRQDARARRV
jgi:hypothetical protein